MFGQEPGAERRQGVLNQHVVTRLDADDIAYYVLHTRAENAKSILISALTKHYKTSHPTKSAGEVNDWVVNLVTAVHSEKSFSLQEYERVKETKIITPDFQRIGDEITLEAATNKATSSSVLGIVKKVADAG